MAKVIFLHLSVILFTGGSLPQCKLGSPLGADTPPWSRHPPREDTHPWEQTPLEQTPPWEQTPPPPGADSPLASKLRHTVNERPVRILLECILVCIYKQTMKNWVGHCWNEKSAVAFSGTQLSNSNSTSAVQDPQWLSFGGRGRTSMVKIFFNFMVVFQEKSKTLLWGLAPLPTGNHGSLILPVM